MTKINALVRSAMGYDAGRGDQVQVTNMSFARMDAGSAEPAEKPLLGLDSAMWFKIIEAAILCITALLIGLFVVRPLISRMFAAQNGAVNMITHITGGSPMAGALPAPRSPAAAAMAAGLPHTAAVAGALPAPDGAVTGPGGSTLTAVPRSSNIDLSQLDGQFGEKSIKKVGEVVSQHPEEALSIIRTWLHQPV